MWFALIRSGQNVGVRCKSSDATVYLRRTLNIIGIGRSEKYQTLHYCSAVLIWLGTFTLAVGFVLSWVLEMHRFKKNVFFSSLQTGLDVMGLVVKMLIMAFMHERLQRADVLMDKLDARCTKPEEHEQIRKLVMFGNRTQLGIVVLYFVYSYWTFAVQLWGGTPLYSLYNPVWDWRDGQRQLVAQSLIEVYAISCACFEVVTADVYPVIYISVQRTHLKLIAERIRRLGRDAKKVDQESRNEELLQCVFDHKNIAELFKTISPIISRTIFVQFVLTGCILGVAMFNILLFPQLSNTIGTLIFIIDLMLQTLPTSYCANSLRDDCDDLALAIFHSNWPEQDERFKKMSLFFMQRTQKPLELTALKMIPITIAANINMIKFAFSIFTLMYKMDFGKTMRE